MMTRLWFAISDLKSGLLLPITQLKQDFGEWQKKLSDSISKDQKFASIADKVRDPGLLRSTTKADVAAEISRRMAEDPQLTPQEMVDKSYEEVKDSIRELNIKRYSTRWRRARSGMHDIFAGLSAFLENFAALAEIMKVPDQQFGGMAFGTMLLLVSFSAHKQMREESIDSAIAEISLALPRLQRLQSIEPSERMRPLIVEIFGLVILFCRETVDYCSSRSERASSTVSAKKMKLDTLTHFHTCILEVRKEIEMSLLERVVNVEQELRVIRAGLSRVESKADLQHKRDILASLEPSLQSLQASRDGRGNLVHIDIARYKAKLSNGLYKSDAYYRRKPIGRPSIATWSTFQDEPTFSDWLQGSDQPMLILAGPNWVGTEDIHLTWLSHASVMLAERAHLENSPPPEDASSSSQDIILHFFFHHELSFTVRTRERKQCNFTAMIEHLIYQLAEQRPDVLWDKQGLIKQRLESPKWTGENPEDAIPFMIGLLQVLLSGLAANSQVMLILDRLDHCHWPACKSRDDEDDALILALTSILKMMKHESLQHLQVKGVCVLEEYAAGRVEKHMPTIPGQGLAWKLDWYQERA